MKRRSVVEEFGGQMLLAFAPFFEAARIGKLTYEAVKDANLHKQGLSDYVTVFVGAGSHAAQSRISYSDWRRLAELAQAIEAQRAATTGAVEDESVVGTADAPKARQE